MPPYDGSVDRPNRKIQLVFFDAGGGHRSAAGALKAVIAEQGHPWDVELIDLQDILGPTDIFRKVTGVRLQDIYNRMLASGRTFGSVFLLRCLHGFIRLYHRPMVHLLSGFWRKSRPDLVVSLIPNFNRALFAGLRAAAPEVPFVTVLTDIADYPPHFWMERQDQFFVCGSQRAMEQARELGLGPDHLFRSSGMILRPTFYRRFDGDRREERRGLGLDPDLPTAVVLFGAQGSPDMLQIARKLAMLGPRLQLILICGRNDKLAARLRSMPGALSMHVVGFTQDVPYFMSLADFLIGKPGPGSVSEALAMNLPVVIKCDSWTLPQERYNAQWVVENDVGVVLESYNEIVPAVNRILDPATLQRMTRNAAAMGNRAVFEIPAFLDTVLERTSPRDAKARTSEPPAA